MRLLCRLLLCLTLTWVGVAQAKTIRLTMYDDGMSCPGQCDAHVVFHPSLNGTAFAHRPGALKAPFAKCTAGEQCELCLESGLKQCLLVMYRGAGPDRDTFDLTPAFFQQACAGTPSPAHLAAKCAQMKKEQAGLNGRINCFSQPEHAQCKTLMADAQARQTADRAAHLDCVAKGQVAYNQGKPVQQQRSDACAYEKKGTGGPNSRGTHWRRLLPGACRDGTLVGRDGLDCCQGDTLIDGPLGLECKGFYPAQP